MGNHVTITKNNQTVECAGEWPASGSVVAHYANGNIVDEWVDEANGWPEAVEILTQHADDIGTRLEYLAP